MAKKKNLSFSLSCICAPQTLITGPFSGHFALNLEMKIVMAYFVSHTQQKKKKM